MYKFRTMKNNAHDLRGELEDLNKNDEVIFKIENDPRIIKGTQVLRNFSLDELPQLFLVLSGKLSLIGPRPERPQWEKELELKLPHYRIRHWIRPGLSGWAQVNYPYGASVEDSRIKLSFDLFYVRNAGFFLDLLILIRTMRLVLKAEGAQPISKSP